MAAMIRRLARNPTVPSSEKLIASNVMDLEGSSSPKPRRSKSKKKKTIQVTIEEVFSVPADFDQNRDMQETLDEELNEEESVLDVSEQVVADSDEEDEEPELMVDGAEEQFAYEELGSRVEGIRNQHQARVEGTP